MHGEVCGAAWHDVQVCNVVHSGNHAVCIRGLEVRHSLHSAKTPSAIDSGVCDASEAPMTTVPLHGQLCKWWWGVILGAVLLPLPGCWHSHCL